MADLASQQVVEAMRAALIAAATSSGSRVYSDRFHPVVAFPTTRVRHVDESMAAEPDDITWPAVRLHVLQVDVEVLVQAASALDAAMAAAAKQVLQALEGTASPLSPLRVALAAQGIRYQAATDGQAANGMATVRFEAQFSTAANDPTTII